MNPNISKLSTYYYLDVFRGVSILCVLLQHAFQSFPIQSICLTATNWSFCSYPPIINLSEIIFNTLNSIAAVGWLGVDMFFVISGFLITGLLLEGLNGNFDIVRFYQRRTFKIIPQYYCALIAGLLIFGLPLNFGNDFNILRPNSAPDYFPVGYFLFLQNYFHHIPTLKHTWSLAIEEHFYLFYPLLFLFICKMNNDTNSRRRNLIITCISCIITCNLLRFLCYTYDFSPLWSLFPTEFIYQTTTFRIDALIVGCLLRLTEPFYISSTNFHKKWMPILILTSISIYLLFIFSLVRIEYDWYGITLAYVAPACLLFALYHTKLRNSPTHAFLSFIGKNSYGIYLWHFLIIFPLLLLSNYLPPYFLILIFFGLSIGAGVLSTQTIEKFGLNFRQRFCP